MAVELTDDIYKRLDNKKKVLSSEAGLLLRWTVVVCAALASLGCAGLVFGFSAIYPVLLDHGVFRDACSEGQTQCEAQGLELATMFTIGTTAVNVWALPGGYILDKLGPKLSALTSCLQVFFGCILFGLGGSGLARWLYHAGFFLMAIGGPSIFVSTVSFSSLFPRFPGLVTAVCVGCFDASSFVFYMLSGITTSGVPFEWVFEGYSIMPFFFGFCALMLWPHEPVLPVDEESDEENGAREEEAGFYSLEHLTFKEQLTVLNPESGEKLNEAFSLMLPAGGIFWIPLVGCVVDHCSIAGHWLVLWISSCCFMITFFVYSASPESEAAAYVAFTFFSFCRPLLYTLGANFTGHMFGFQTFGTIYGLIFAIAGTFNSLVAVLKRIAYRSGYQAVNGGIFALVLMAAAFPALLFLRNRAKRRRQALMEKEEELATKARIRSPSISRKISFTLRSGLPPSPSPVPSRPNSLTGTPLHVSERPSRSNSEEYLDVRKI